VGLLGLLPWGGRPLVHREQELRVIVTARDMARGGSWLIPSYLGEPRFNKPPLMYWVSAGWFKLTGTEPRPALARLPNAVLGTGLLLALFTLGMPLVGRRRAFLAALTAGTCPLFLRFGRLCETDIPFAFCEAVSMLMLYGAIRAPHRLHRWLISGLAAGIGFMIKGPAAIILPLAACGAFLLTSPPASRKAFRPARMGLWLLVVAVIGCPWYVFIFLSQASQAAAGDVGYELGALLRHSEHQGTPGFISIPSLLRSCRGACCSPSPWCISGAPRAVTRPSASCSPGC
jgi:4-amino-4-deoxy-L-arabinose transferase-like glycosyltransferase